MKNRSLRRISLVKAALEGPVAAEEEVSPVRREREAPELVVESTGLQPCRPTGLTVFDRIEGHLSRSCLADEDAAARDRRVDRPERLDVEILPRLPQDFLDLRL